ncbi:MAG: helix-turn-helix transcriptional regulator [Vallitaleaceae bacterium]|nr:helix-turn-helix transcriptional regulator [Vallitaleaceae bacterium]
MRGSERIKSQFTKDVWTMTEKHEGKEILLLQPKQFIGGVEFTNQEYNLIFTQTPPPDTWINGKLHQFNGRCVIIFQPRDRIFCTKTKDAEPYFSFMISSTYMCEVLAKMEMDGRELRFSQICNPFSAEILQLLGLLDQEFHREDCKSMLVESISLQLIMATIRSYPSNLEKVNEEAAGKRTNLERVVSYIEQFYAANLQIEDLAKEAGLSSYYFVRAFKKKYTLTPHRYLLKVRLQKARELLESGRYKVEEVASLCGFVNASHFTATFHKELGELPSNFTISAKQ